MDVLADVLQWLRVEGHYYARAELRAPWGVRVPSREQVVFHVIDRGGAILQCEGMAPLSLGSGDLVMFARGTPHVLTDALETDPMEMEAFFASGSCAEDAKGRMCPVMKFEGTGVPTTMSCGHFSFHGGDEHPLLSLLPPVLYISSQDKQAAPWLDSILQLISYESSQMEPGADTALARLLDLLFVQIVRVWLARQPEGQAGWLGALRDESIGRSIRLIHERPSEPWTVASLGKSIGMSRSGFSARFQSLVGQPPLKYLTRWRMCMATRILEEEPALSVEQVAKRVGYDSIVSFSRAFKRYYDVAPGIWRKQHIHAFEAPPKMSVMA